LFYFVLIFVKVLKKYSRSEHYRALKTAEDSAKAAKKNIWTNYVEEVEEKIEFEEKEEKNVCSFFNLLYFK